MLTHGALTLGVKRRDTVHWVPTRPRSTGLCLSTSWTSCNPPSVADRPQESWTYSHEMPSRPHLWYVAEVGYLSLSLNPELSPLSCAPWLLQMCSRNPGLWSWICSLGYTMKGGCLPSDLLSGRTPKTILTPEVPVDNAVPSTGAQCRQH